MLDITIYFLNSIQGSLLIDIVACSSIIIVAECVFIKSRDCIEVIDEVKDGVSCISEGRRKTCIDADENSPNEDRHDVDDVEDNDDDDGEEDQAPGSQLIAQRVEALSMERMQVFIVYSTFRSICDNISITPLQALLVVIHPTTEMGDLISFTKVKNVRTKIKPKLAVCRNWKLAKQRRVPRNKIQEGI